MNASKLARWAALPAAAIVATSAGVAFAEDSTPATTEATETTDTDTADDSTRQPEDAADVAAEVRAFLATDEGRALLAEVVAAEDLDEPQLEELKAAIAELRVAVRGAAAERTASAMELEDLREQLRLLAAGTSGADDAEEAEDTDDGDEAEDTGDGDQVEGHAGHRRGWQEKQAGRSRGWNAADREVSEDADADHGEKRGWQAKHDGAPRGEYTDAADAADERGERDDD